MVSESKSFPFLKPISVKPSFPTLPPIDSYLFLQGTLCHYLVFISFISQLPTTVSDSLNSPLLPKANLTALSEPTKGQVNQGSSSLQTKLSLFCHFSTLELEEMLYCQHRIGLSELPMKGWSEMLRRKLSLWGALISETQRTGGHLAGRFIPLLSPFCEGLWGKVFPFKPSRESLAHWADTC